MWVAHFKNALRGNLHCLWLKRTVQASTGNSEASTGNSEASTGNSKASTGNSEASTAYSEASIGCLEASTGNSEACLNPSMFYAESKKFIRKRRIKDTATENKNKFSRAKKEQKISYKYSNTDTSY